MDIQANINYNRIAEAIDFLENNFQRQPSLDEVAAHIHVSPYHFQRLFTDWVGVSPKKFLQYITVEHAKNLLRKNQATLFDATHETGLSSTSRLHEMFINIEGMTPAEYKNEGENLNINYSFAESPFGSIVTASTAKGICHIAFFDDEKTAFNNLKAAFPKANFNHFVDVIQQNALLIFTQDWDKLHEIKLHLKGTDFQIKVWESLLKVPFGGLSTYGNIAADIRNPKASRAVGTAIGQNPVAYLIPCHRVIQSTGTFGGYMWGKTRKTTIIGWEQARLQVSHN